MDLPESPSKYVVVVNTSKRKIPSKTMMSQKDQGTLAKLQRRKHLRQPKPIRDRQGAVVETLLPLDQDERAMLEDLEQKKCDELEPCVSSYIFPFERWGKQGCAWLMPEGWANLVVKVNPRRLSILAPGTALPEGVTPLCHGRPPTAFQGTFHHNSPEELFASPSHETSWLEGHAVRDGITVEQGSVLAPVGRGLPGTTISLK